ncbi:MAG: protein kinase [Planctomycetes bacterium]|nr:protein kinase [Planctomycetota bacterium]
MSSGCPCCLLKLGLAAESRLTVAGRHSGTFSGEFASAPTEPAFRGILSQFGDYELLSEIARGGMGVVYRARQRSLNRTVAVKLILAGQLASLESVRRFRLEAEAAARLRHPGIVQIYEVGEVETQHFFSMELIEGHSLAECIDAFRPAPNDGASSRREQFDCIAELVAGVARALDYAHQRGVLHRDLKPSNILLDEQGRSHLTDFGLAKLTGHDSGGLTLSAAVLGTPGYLAPEQVDGSPEQVTTSADVYGLGATLYELLTGRPPFQGATAWETMRWAVERPPVSPRQINPAISRDLETIAMRCLEKSPERRYPSAAAVADELDRFRRGEPILARPVGGVEKVWRWCLRNKGPASLAAALALAIVVGTVVAFWQWGRAELANEALTANVSNLEWAAIDTMLAQGESSRALAKLAALLRRDPGDWKAATLAISIMEQRRFPLPAAPVIRHPDGAELSVARLSPDGRRIVTASFDGTARLWDAATSEPLGEVMKHDAEVTWAEFSPNGETIATVSKDRSIRFWNADAGRPARAPLRQDEAVERLRFRDDGKYLLVQTSKSVSIVDGAEGRILVGPKRFSGKVLAARFIHDADAFFVTTLDAKRSRIGVFNVLTGNETAGLDLGPISKADVADDMSYAAVIDASGVGHVCDFPSGKNMKALEGSVGRLDDLSFGPKSPLIAVIGRHQWARVWDARTAQPFTGELPHYYLVRGAALTEDSRRLLSWADDSLAQIWDLSTDKAYCEPMRHQNRVVHAELGRSTTGEMCLTTLSHLKSRTDQSKTGAACLWRIHDGRNPRDRTIGAGDARGHDGSRLTHDDRRLIYGTTDGKVHIHELETGSPICQPLEIAGGAWGLLLTRDDRKLIVTSSRGQVSMWSLPEVAPLTSPETIPTTIQPAVLGPDERQFATGSTDHLVRIWDAETGRVLRQMRHGSEINSLAYSPDGSLLASAGEDRVVRIWRSADGAPVRELIGHRNEIMSVKFSPDGKRIATASQDFSGRIWDTATGGVLAELPHRGEVLEVAFDPTGRYVATASRDRTAMIWDAATGLPHSRALFHAQGVRNVTFSADGRRLFTFDFRGLRIWDVETSYPLSVHLEQMFIGGTGFQGPSMRASITTDAQAAFVATDSLEAKLWHFTTPDPGAPSWFPELLEAVAGQRFADDAERPESVPPDRFLELERRLRGCTESDDYSRWARRWLTQADEPKQAAAR